MPNYNLVPLDEFLSYGGLEYMHKQIDRYECVMEGNLDYFLKEKAIEFSKRDLSKTYLAIDANNTILGYFTIGIKCFNLPFDDGKCSTKFYKTMNPDKGVIQSYLIGKLSRSKESEKGLGSNLLMDAINLLHRYRTGIGCRVVRLDCEDSLIAYYENNGFKHIRKNPETELNQMVKILS